MKNNKKGSFTSFISIILTSIIIVMTILVNASSIRVEESLITGALTVQQDLILSEYSQKLQDRYGIFATSIMDKKDAEIYLVLKGVSNLSNYQCKGINSLDNENVFKNAVVEYTKPRLPLHLSLQFFSRFSKMNEIISKNKTKDKSNLYGKSINNSNKNNTNNNNNNALKNNSENKTNVSLPDFVNFENIIKLLSLIDRKIFNNTVSEEVKKYFDFDNLDTLLKNGYSNQIFEFDISKDIKSEMTISENTLNNISSFLDKIFNNKSSFIYDKLCFEYYVSSMFSCMTNKTFIDNSEVVRKDLRYRVFDSMPIQTKLEIEKIIFGNENPKTNENFTELSITSIRFILHMISNIYDKSQKAKDKAIAASLSAAIAIASAGTVTIPPENMEIVILILRCISNSISDYKNLIKGNNIPLLPGKIEYNIDTYYIDYLQLFLLLVPENVKVYRMLNIMRNNLFLNQVPLYAGIKVSIDYRAYSYKLAGGYYENENKD